MNYKCPVCGKDDIVKKISAIIAGEIVHSHASNMGVSSSNPGFSASYGYSQGLSQTELSRSLAFSSKGSTASKISGSVFIAAGLLVAGILIFFLILQASIPGGFTEAGWIWWDIVLLAGVIVLVLVGVSDFSIVSPKDAQARVIWEKLYYCSRDDIVHDPDSGKHAPRSLMNVLLY